MLDLYPTEDFERIFECVCNAPFTTFSVNGRALKLKAALETELEALDRSLLMMLIQIPPHEADSPPARNVSSVLFIFSLLDLY